MKRKVLSTMLAAVMALSLGTGFTTVAMAEEDLQTVGFLSAAWSDDYCKRLNDALVELGPEYGLEVDAVNGAPTGTPDLNGYIEGINALAEKEPDAMIVQPLFSLPDYCLQFNEKDVPLCFINISPELSDKSKDLEYYYAGCFDTAIGSQLAEEMSKGLKENAKIGMICLTYGQTNAAQRRDGFEAWMAENRPDVEIVEVNYVEKVDPSNSQAIFEDWIQKYGVDGLDGVASQGSMLTQGIVESMRAHGMDSSSFIVAGISASTGDWIRDGLEYVELFQDPYSEASAALNTIRHMLDGTTDELELMDGEYNVVAVPMTPVTAENVDEVFPE
ncbi:MAG: substrate-binding domain-containing protein [Blautia sp.]|nr:substrate-binding domain-containing protein [Blautia sp.]